MDKILEKLTRGARGTQVKFLHRTLRDLGFAAPAAERVSGGFGPGTEQSLKEFQISAGLAPTGTVNTQTARKLMASSRKTELEVGIAGQVSMEGKPAEGLTIRLIQSRAKEPLFEVETDKEGRFELGSPAAPLLLDRFDNAALRILDEKGGLLLELALPRMRPEEQLRLELAPFSEAGATGGASLAGVVRFGDGRPAEGAEVTLLRKSLRDETVIAALKTDDVGRYRFVYPLGDEVGTAGLEVRAVYEDETISSGPLPGPIVEDPVDLTLGGVLKGQSDFLSIGEALAPVLGTLAPQELVETADQKDISYLSQQLGLPEIKVLRYAAAHRLAIATELPADHVYGLMSGNVIGPVNLDLFDGTSAEIDAMIRGKLLASLTDTAGMTLENELQRAARQSRIPPPDDQALKATLARIDSLRRNQVAQAPYRRGKASLSDLMTAAKIPAGLRDAFVESYAETGNTGKSLGALKDRFSEARLKKLALVLETGDMAQNHLPLVLHLLDEIENTPKRLRAKAALDTEGWVATLNTLPAEDRVPENILKSAPDLAEATKVFAERLRQRFTRRYPTEAYTGELLRPDQEPVMTLQEETAEVLRKAEGFDLLKTNITQYLAKQGPALLGGIDDPVRVTQNLQALQRVARLSPSTKVAQRLMADGITSARKVRDIGRQQFLRTYADSGLIARSDSFTIMRRATVSDATTTALLGNIRAQKEDRLLQTFFKSGGGATGDLAEVEEILPSYRTLFGSTDYCECQHCRSVLSPAAYLADMLRFLSFRLVVSGSDSAKDRLFERRPDIGDILLNCKNTNTPLPHIDLVNELLEAWVAPAGGWLASGRQTTWDAADLRLLPEYVNGQAYDTLKTSVFPFDAPFDVDHAEAMSLLQANKTTHLGFLEALDDARGATWVALGLSEAQRDVIVGPATEVWRYWGLAQNGNDLAHPKMPRDRSRNITGSWLNVLRQVPIFLHRASLSYKGLLRLLQTQWLGRFDVSVEMIDPSLGGCDIDNLRLDGAKKDFFHAAHVFLRLQHATGLDIVALDRLMASVGIEAVSLRYLNRLGAAVALMHRLGLAPDEVAALASDISTHGFDEIGEGRDWARVPSPYERVFARPAVDAEGTIFPTDAAALAGTLTQATTSLMSALGLTDADLAQIRRAVSLSDPAAGAPRPLTLSNLSRLYRATLLMKALGLPAATFADLVAFYDDGIWGSQGDVRQFVLLHDRLTDAGLDPVILMPVVLTAGDDALTAPVTESDIESFVTSLQIAHKGIRDAALTGAPPADQVAALLPLWPGLTEADDLDIALSVIDDTFAGTAAERTAFWDRVFADLPNGADMAAVFTPLPAADGPAREAALSTRQSWVAEQITRYMLEETTRQTLAAFAPATADVSEVLMTALVPPGAGATVLRLLLAPSIAAPDVADPTLFAASPKRTDLPAVFDAIELLARAAFIATELGMSAKDCEWLLREGAGQNLLRLERLPTLARPGMADVQRFVRTLSLYRFNRDMVRGSGTLTALLDAALGGADLAELERLLVDLTAMEAGDVAALAQIAGLTSAGSYLQASRYDVLRRASKMADRMSATPAQLRDWAVTGYDASHVKALRDTLRAHLGEIRWADAGAALQDGLRRKKRDALVNYLIANPSGGVSVFSSADIFDHLLVDPEMDACFTTSRLKLALSSVQLFVQRCQFAMEPEIDTSDAHDEVWAQWVWMKNYRVWEANRKVFLYPENWIEPELSQNKSPLFKMLEEELTQAPVTKETAEQALASYLDRLAEISRLQIVAHYMESSGGKKVLHVFARTHSTPRVYHHRTRDFATGLWSAWAKLDLDIEADHLIPVIWNRRMNLFWPMFSTEVSPTMETATSDDTLEETNRYIRVQLMHSEYRNGVWSPARQLKGSFVRNNVQPHSTFHFKAIKMASPELPGRQDLSIRVAMTTSERRDEYDPAFAETDTPKIYGDFLFRGRVDRPLIRSDIDADADIPYEHLEGIVPYPFSNTALSSPRQSHLRYQHFHSDFATGIPEIMDLLQSSRSTISNVTVFKQAKAPFEITVPNQYTQFGAVTPFFYQDAAKSYFVQPIEYYWNGRYYATDIAYPGAASARKTNFLFQTFAHPFADAFQRELDSDGLEGLYRRSVQIEPWGLPGTGTMFSFDDRYDPTRLVERPYPGEDVDFSQTGPYALYNWEIFFLAPFFIANKLSTNQRFEEAMEFYHLIFNPLSREAGEVPQRFWVTRPFYEASGAETQSQRIKNLLLAVSDGDADVIRQITAWRDNPFDPHLIATMRPTAYQKSIVFKYIHNLLQWADQLFRRDSIESINEATQIYLIAAAIVGAPPEAIPATTPNEDLSYRELEASLDDFSNALLEVENIAGGAPAAAGDTGTTALPRMEYFYFCVPANDRLEHFRSIVTDRLFKIRNCMNIDGLRRSLALFEPPIDPAALVKAFAAGGGVGDVLSALNARRPHYRFASTLEFAYSAAMETERLGADLLAALQSRDAEALAILRNSHLQTVRKQAADIFDVRIKEAEFVIESLNRNKEAAEARKAYYSGLENWNAAEIIWASLLAGSMVSHGVGTVLQGVAASSRAMPDFTIGGAGAFGSPVGLLTMGGGQVHAGLGTAANVLFNVGGILSQGAGMSLTIANFERRAKEWDHHAEVAQTQIDQMGAAINAAEARVETLKREHALAEKELQTIEDEGDFLETKFTNTQLYDWMISRLSALHFQSYQLAHDIARQAEECFRFESGVFDTSFVQFGHWNSLQKGLLAGKHVTRDLKRMEAAFRDQNQRRQNMTRHISLAEVDPVALHQLRTTGECFVTLPEALFDHDNPGQYARRISSMAVTVPAVVGPYSGVNCQLELLEDHIRSSASLEGGYARATDGDGNPIEDPRFLSELGGIQAISLSHGQRDTGLFDFTFHDGRYRPFEGAGVISTWRIRLDQRTNRFDLDSMTDFVLHMDYTALNGGDVLREAALAEVVETSPKQGVISLSAAQDFAPQWARFLYPDGAGQSLQVPLTQAHFPWVHGERSIAITSLTIVLNFRADRDYSAYEDGGELEAAVTSSDGAQLTFSLAGDTSINLRPSRSEAYAPAPGLGAWTLDLTEDALSAISSELTVTEEEGNETHTRLDPDKVSDITLLMGFEAS